MDWAFQYVSPGCILKEEIQPGALKGTSLMKGTFEPTKSRPECKFCMKKIFSMKEKVLSELLLVKNLNMWKDCC